MRADSVHKPLCARLVHTVLYELSYRKRVPRQTLFSLLGYYSHLSEFDPLTYSQLAVRIAQLIEAKGKPLNTDEQRNVLFSH